jgi:hypothetical protein
MVSSLKQGSHSVEEYYKEREFTMIYTNVEEANACFLQGLNHPFKCIVDYQSYTTNPQ